MILFHILRNILETAANIAPAGENINKEESARPGKGMVHRQKSDCVVALNKSCGRDGRGHNVLVAEHYALAFSGCSGGENDCCNIFRKRRLVKIALVSGFDVGVTLFNEVIEIADFYVFLKADAVGFFELFNGTGEFVRVIDCVAVASSHNVDDVIVHELCVKGNNGVLSGKYRIKTNNPVIAVITEDCNLFSGKAAHIKILSKANGVIPNLVKGLCPLLCPRFKIDILLLVAALDVAVFDHFACGFEIGYFNKRVR